MLVEFRDRFTQVISNSTLILFTKTVVQIVDRGTQAFFEVDQMARAFLPLNLRQLLWHRTVRESPQGDSSILRVGHFLFLHLTDSLRRFSNRCIFTSLARHQSVSLL